MASDDDNDELLYDVDTASTTAAPNDNALFEVDNNGQLSLESDDGLDYENPGDALDTPGTARTVNTAGTGIEYTVVIRATDPSSASDTATVTVLLTNVNEAPAFAKDADGKFLQTTLYIAEHGAADATGPAIFTNSGLSAAVADYSATDQDGTTLDTEATFTLEGADKDDFSLTPAGALTTRQTVTGPPEVLGLRANFEDKSSYSITIVAQSTGTTGNEDRGTKYTRLDVMVKVVDREDAGEVKLSALQSQVNIPVVATHTDQDGGVTDRHWYWYRGGALPEDLTTLFEDDGDLTTAAGNTACVDGDDPDTDTVEVQTEATVLWRIDGETAALYTPGSADVGRILHVVAEYKDDFNADAREEAGASSDAAVQASNPANTAPKFPDQDLSTPGDQSDVAMRSMAENQDKGTRVGEPIPAGDADRNTPEGNLELLTYTIDDTDNFSVNQKDEISTAVKLDYEMQSMYTVMLTATDPSGATDTITVMISVTDENDPAIISTAPPADNPPAFPAGTAARSVDENMPAGTPVGAPVVAMDDDGDTVTYTDDSDYFDIGEDGQIETTMMLDYESMTSHMVTVTATDTSGNTDMVTVTIMVVDMYPGCTVADNNGLTTDCEVLLGAMDTLGGSLNWSEDSPLWMWDGVTLSADEPRRVTRIWLRDQGLNGMIPASLARVEMLTVLNLNQNALMGEIPDLSALSLTELYLTQNMLTGGVPGWLNGETQMTDLWLWGNDLSGSLPNLSGMTSLDILKLNGNAGLTGIDAAMLPGSLRWLIAGETDVGATMPDLSSLMNITVLWLGETGLSGAIPVASIPSSVTSLNLKGNSLSGAIPDMTGLMNLQWLRLQRNDLSGEISATLGDLASVTRIWLYENDLTGISAGLANAADTLEVLEIRGNSFTATTCLPAALADVEDNDFDMAGHDGGQLATCQ